MKSKILTALASLAIAMMMWLYVITVVNPEWEETYYNVPVVLDGESVLHDDRGLMITSNTDIKVTLKLRGNRTDLNKLNSSNITLIADLTKIYEAGVKSLQYSISYPGDVQNNAIEVVSRNPSTITLTVVEWGSKEIPVTVEYNGSVPDGYIADKQNAVLDHTAVTVTGPKDMLKQISEAKVTVDLNNQTETIVENYRVTLCGADGEPVEDVSSVTTSIGQVRVTVTVQQVKEIGLKVNVINGGGATDKTSSIEILPNVIRVSGNRVALEDLDEILLGTIDLGELTEDTEMTFPITLPEGVTNLTGETEATVSVKFPDLWIRTFVITDIQAINVPKGMEVDMITKILAVDVRGPRDIVERLTAEDVVVQVDFSDWEMGINTVEPVILVSDGTDLVGAVNSASGSYKVTAELKVAAPDPVEDPTEPSEPEA